MADTVIVLSKRPAQIKMYNIELNEDELPSSKNTQGFQSLL